MFKHVGVQRIKRSVRELEQQPCMPHNAIAPAAVSGYVSSLGGKGGPVLTPTWPLSAGAAL